MTAGDGFRGTREEMERAIRRLHALEYVILGFVALVALGGGALVAYILSSGTDLPFRATWIVLSLLLFIVPGMVVLARDRWKRRKAGRADDDMERERDGG